MSDWPRVLQKTTHKHMSTPYTTVKSLTDDLDSLTKSHAMVQSVHWGTISDLANPKDASTPGYPYVFYTVDSITFDRTQYHVNITGFFQTRIEDTETEMLQGISDMTEIARDIFAYYAIQAGNTPPWGINRESTVNGHVMVEAFQDSVLCVAVQFNFDIDVPISKCYFPLKA